MKKLIFNIFNLSDKKKIIVALFAGFLLTACGDDMLREDPKDRLATVNFYKTKADAQAAIDAIYQPIRSTYSGTDWGGQFTGAEDYAMGTGIYLPLSQYVMNSSAIARTDAAWRAFYQTIRNANMALKYIPPIAMDETEKNAFLGEARFLRALAYRDLVRSWGGVPLRTEPTESLGASAISAERASAADVYNLIIEDLKFAETHLPNKQALAGKPSKWAAKTMLADIYLYTEKWPEARDKADEVIKSGAYALVPVTQPNDFELIFGPTALTSTEDVFSFKYSRSLGGSQIAQQYSMSNSAYSSGGYGSFYGLPTFPLLRDWDKNDLRYKFNIYTSYPTKSGTIVQTSPDQPLLFGKFKDAGFAPSHGNDFPIYRYPDALLIYAEAANQVNNGPTALAVERLNMVRRRGYGYNPTSPSPVDYTLSTAPTAQAFRNLVLQERAYEFLCEFKRWFDLVRTKTVKQVIKAAKGTDVTDNFLLFPIPKVEMDNNPALGPEDQNPGY
ncbi:membrane protein [Adhaeribacter aerolatus]|uniref:Membrane protein n=1 Tax=Adhaeribacter aerolatus TaxID=670289 RepID=A0A512AXL1_9BACT|nr:RagB/SusD family nutrient uptake outer membrane protein [Adhaeribacter aerolatus]GEO04455.1 membrane protein [Adhaeribacter aerolatus]